MAPVSEGAEPVSQPVPSAPGSSDVPAVVAVMVLHQPEAASGSVAPWSETALLALAAQDYPNLQYLVLVTGRPDTAAAGPITDAVGTALPTAVVRFLGANPGFGPACNTVLELVEGDAGFFCLLHDDVALAPDAITRLVEELYRTNAGLVGPKLVDWDEPTLLQHVGVQVDRLGERDPIVDVGEKDQEQHDAVRDVFVLPTACMLVRADLFRTIGGFESTLPLVGDDLDLCWRVHTTGARVIIAPSAVGRHRERITERLPEESADQLPALAERERINTVLSLTATSRLPLVIAELVLFTVAQLFIGLFSSNARRSLAATRALLAAPLSTGDIRRRRARVKTHRLVGDDEVHALQARGSARLSVWLRRRARTTGVAESEANKAGGVVATSQRSTVLLWTVIALGTIIGGRSLWLHGVEDIGQFVRFDGGARDLLTTYSSGWWASSFGEVAAVPSGIALLAGAGVLALGRMGLLHTVLVLLLPVIGYVGVWQFASVFGVRRARLFATSVYAAVPLPYAALASGRWSGLIVYASLPWVAHCARIIVGHRVTTLSAPLDARDYFAFPSDVRRRRTFATLTLITAVTIAFEPAFIATIGIVSTVWFLVTGIHGAWKRATVWLSVSLTAVVLAIVLHLPWATTYVQSGWWDKIMGAAVPGGRGVGLASLARFDVGDVPLAWLSIGLYVPTVVALIVVRGARSPWALRGALLAAVALVLAVLDDRALLPAHAAEPSVMLVPVAFGLAVACGALGASLSIDIRRARFGWRQPLGAVAALALVVGVLPALLATVNGRWNQTRTSLTQLLGQLPEEGEGDYRVLFLGDSRVLPVAPVNLGWGVAYGVMNGPRPTTADMWEPYRSDATDLAEVAARGIVRGTTARAGRLLAPLGVRFVVVPIIDNAASRRDDPIASPRGLTDALASQLDLRRRYASPDLVIYENTSWIPVRSMLAAGSVEASSSGGAVSLIATDIAGASPILHTDRDELGTASVIDAGTVHVAVPFTSSWKLEVGGVPVTARPAFGVTTAFDVPQGGTAILDFDTSVMRSLLILVQFGLWVFVFVLAVLRPRKTVVMQQ